MISFSFRIKAAGSFVSLNGSNGFEEGVTGLFGDWRSLPGRLWQ